ncbi:GNAT family N-acetyltransferase [Kribbella sp. NPDC055071]
MSVTVRPVQPSDAVAVNELLSQLGYPQDDASATADRLKVFAEDPSSAAYAAESTEGSTGGLLGVIAVHVAPFFEREGSQGRIVALVVSDRARRLGVGSRLVAAAESFAAERGSVRMEVTSADRRDDAHAFYLGCGYINQAGTSSRFLRDLPTS